MDIGKVNSNIINNMASSAVQSSDKSSDSSFEERLKNAMNKSDDKELKEVCKQFEGIMLKSIYKQMKATIIKSDLVKEDPGMDIFQSMLDDELMDRASQTGSFGLADSLYKQLSKQIKSDGKKDENNAVEKSQSADK